MLYLRAPKYRLTVCTQCRRCGEARRIVKKYWSPLLLCGFLLSAGAAVGQDLQSYVSDMNKALATNVTQGSVGSVDLHEGHILEFDLSVPSPLIAFLVKAGKTAGSTKFAFLTSNVLSISADLKSLNEDAITESPVFSSDGVSKYKLGDVGDMIVVKFVTTGEPSISTTTYDRSKLAKLQPGKPTAEQLGAVNKRDAEEFLVFQDPKSARDFEKALRAAIVAAKAQ